MLERRYHYGMDFGVCRVQGKTKPQQLIRAGVSLYKRVGGAPEKSGQGSKLLLSDELPSAHALLATPSLLLPWQRTALSGSQEVGCELSDLRLLDRAGSMGGGRGGEACTVACMQELHVEYEHSDAPVVEVRLLSRTGRSTGSPFIQLARTVQPATITATEERADSHFAKQTHEPAAMFNGSPDGQAAATVTISMQVMAGGAGTSIPAMTIEQQKPQDVELQQIAVDIGRSSSTDSLDDAW